MFIKLTVIGTHTGLCLVQDCHFIYCTYEKGVWVLPFILFARNTVKKGQLCLPSPAGMSLTELSLAGNNLIIIQYCPTTNSIMPSKKNNRKLGLVTDRSSTCLFLDLLYIISDIIYPQFAFFFYTYYNNVFNSYHKIQTFLINIQRFLAHISAQNRFWDACFNQLISIVVESTVNMRYVLGVLHS